MDTLQAVALAAGAAFVAALLGAAAAGVAAFYLVRRRIVEPKVVYGAPRKKKTIIIPGEGALVIKERRPARVNDDAAAYRAERKEVLSRRASDEQLGS
jgi:hypothetical protein